MNVHDYLFDRRDLHEWHHDFDGLRAGDQNRHGTGFSDAPAFTHCICYGAAARTAEPLLAEVERLRRWDAQLRQWIIDHRVEVGDIDLSAEPPYEKPLTLAEVRALLQTAERSDPTV